MKKEHRNYLDFSLTEQPDAVEKFFCEKFANLQSRPLTTEESKILITLLFIKDDKEEKIVELNESFLNEKNEKTFHAAISVLKKRYCNQYNFEIDNRLTIMLSTLFDSFGKVVMYGTYLAYWAKKNNKKIITIDDFCTYIFPFGVPNEKELDELWEEQKVKRPDNVICSDNLLDYGKATISLIQ